MDFEKQIRQATLDQKLQPEDNFILKVCYSLTESIILSLRSTPPFVLFFWCHQVLNIDL